MIRGAQDGDWRAIVDVQQVAVLDERAELPHGRVVYPEPFRH